VRFRTTATAALLAAGLSLGTAATADASTVQATGVQLKSALLPASDFPSGYTVGGATDSGSHLASGKVKYNLATVSCSTWENNFGSSGFGDTATATDTVSQSASSLLSLSAFGQLVYQFKTSSAASHFYAGLRALASRCTTIRSSQGGVTATAKVRVVSARSIDGHAAFWIDETISASGVSGQANTLITVAGTDVFAIDNTGFGVAPPAKPTPASLLVKLITRVQALR
jgi:hypothetical protein